MWMTFPIARAAVRSKKTARASAQMYFLQECGL
jgi:hypothetical protein